MKTVIEIGGRMTPVTLRRLPSGGYSATSLIMVAGERRSFIGRGESSDGALLALERAFAAALPAGDTL
jgi:hypothetical protein